MATMSFQQLRKQAEELMAKADALEQEEKSKFFDGMLKGLADAGFSVQDLMSHAGFEKKAAVKGKGNANAGKTLPPKFVGPKGEHWSGRGHQPAWYKEAIAAGKTSDSMLIK